MLRICQNDLDRGWLIICPFMIGRFGRARARAHALALAVKRLELAETRAAEADAQMRALRSERDKLLRLLQVCGCCVRALGRIVFVA